MDGDRHVIAYGQVEMNRERIVLESTEDYHKLAKRFYENAREYYELCQQSMPLLQKGNMALNANMCFACELYLKTLLLIEEYNFYKMKKPENRHNLNDLFGHLSDDVKKCIKNSEYMKPFGKFDLEIKEIGNGFEVLRYISECRGMMVNIYFLYSFMSVLASISKYVIDQIE